MEFDPTTEKPAEKPHRHCWHRSPVQHTHLKMHADVRCCHCGEDRCLELEARIPDGHGEFIPNADRRLMPKRPKGAPVDPTIQALGEPEPPPEVDSAEPDAQG